MKKSAFFENAKQLTGKLGIIPLMYGSLGLEYITDENLNADDIDILIPDVFLRERWNEFKAVLADEGYVLFDEHEHTFRQNDIYYSYASIEELESFAGIALSEIEQRNKDGVRFRVLSLEQYLKVYRASARDGYRVNVRKKKDGDKIAFIEKHLKRQELLVFNQMTDTEMYRMVHEIYSEASMENASDKHPDLTDLTEAIKEEERYFVGFLKNFLSKEQNTYYVLESDGQWVSALRLTKLDDFYYMEALETAPEHRRKGYAEALIREVISSLSREGAVKIRSNVNKKNLASLATHRKCGFTIEEENGINYLCGEQYDHLYGMMYSSEPEEKLTSENEPRPKNEMVPERKTRSEKELDAVITRIRQMESYLDDVLQAINTSPETMNAHAKAKDLALEELKSDPAIREKMQALKNYYESGQWLADYERDERGELPAELKRGVLSQDTLYDLLHELNAKTEHKN